MRKRRNASQPSSARALACAGTSRGGELRNMAVLGDQPRDAAKAEPRAQAVDQAVDIGLIFGPAKAICSPDRVRRRARRAAPDRSRSRDRAHRRGGEPLDEQRAHRSRIAQRARGAGGDALDRAVGAEQRQLDAPGTFAARRQRGRAASPAARSSPARPLRARSARQKAARRRKARPAGAASAVRARGRARGRAGASRSPPKRAASGARGTSRISPMRLKPTGAAPPPSRRTGAAPRAAAAQARARSSPEARSRSSPKRATAQAAPMRVGNGGARRKAETGHPRQQIVAQRRLAAEQMRAAGDIEQQAVRRISAASGGYSDRTNRPWRRADARRPPASSGTTLRAGCMARACASARPVAGRAVRRRHRQRRADRDCRVCRTPPGEKGLTPLPRDAVGRKPPQPEAQNALRARNAAPHCSTPRSMIRVPRRLRRAARPARRTEPVSSFIASLRAQEGRCGADDPARRRGERFVVRRGAQEQAERVAGRGGERQTPRSSPDRCRVSAFRR